MKRILSEKNLVVVLFVMVLITFSLAQEDSKKMEKMYSGATTTTASNFLKKFPAAKTTITSNESALPGTSAQ